MENLARNIAVLVYLNQNDFFRNNTSVIRQALAAVLGSDTMPLLAMINRLIRHVDPAPLQSRLFGTHAELWKAIEHQLDNLDEYEVVKEILLLLFKAGVQGDYVQHSV